MSPACFTCKQCNTRGHLAKDCPESRDEQESNREEVDGGGSHLPVDGGGSHLLGGDGSHLPVDGGGSHLPGGGGSHLPGDSSADFLLIEEEEEEGEEKRGFNDIRMIFDDDDDDEEVIQCFECNLSFPTEESRSLHISSHYKNDEVGPCNRPEGEDPSSENNADVQR